MLHITHYTFSCFARLLLIFWGDAELNPGPLLPEEVKKVLKILEILPKIDKGQDVFLDELAAFPFLFNGVVLQTTV